MNTGQASIGANGLGGGESGGGTSSSSSTQPGAENRKMLLKKATNKIIADQGKYVDIRTAEKNLLRQGIIPPRYKYKVMWDMFIGGVILYSVIIVPYRIGFDDQPRPG